MNQLQWTTLKAMKKIRKYNSMKSKLIVIGASGHGKVIADIALKMKCWDKIIFLDKNDQINKCLDMEVYFDHGEYEKYVDDYDFIVAIGNNKIRKLIMTKLENINASLGILIHPSAVIGCDVSLGVGTVVMAGAIINTSTQIGKGCIINTGSTIDHDNFIEDYVHISPGVKVAGGVTIGMNSWIGIGSTIINNKSICADVMVGAGTVVIKDIDESGTYVGCPARRLY